jgi:hypothetical protein
VLASRHRIYPLEIDRLIHMDGREPPADTPYTPLGYSADR